MIRARHTFLGKKVSELYSGYGLNAAFGQIRMFGDRQEDSGLPLLLLANHFSWWDGFIQYRLNQNFYRRKLHVIMLEEQLQRFMILNQCGCFSIRKNSRDMINSLRYCTEILSDPGNMLLFFPQGEIQSLYTDRFRFQNGISYLFKHLQHDIEIIFNVNLVDYYSRKKPSLYIYRQSYRPENGYTLEETEEAFNVFASSCKSKQKAL